MEDEVLKRLMVNTKFGIHIFEAGSVAIKDGKELKIYGPRKYDEPSGNRWLSSFNLKYVIRWYPINPGD